MVEEFIYKIIELRKEKGLSRAEVCERLNIALSTYAGYEQGYREPSLSILKKLADLFECSIDYMMGREDDFGNIIIKPIAPNLSPEEQISILTFHTLPKDLQQRAAAYISKLAQIAEEEKGLRDSL